MIKNTPQILKGLEQRVGCKIDIEPRYNFAGRISFSDGRNFYFKNTSLDINNYGASEVAKDKGYTRFFMEDMGYKIPKGATFFSDYWCEVNKTENNSLEAIKFANSLQYPVIVKPNSGSKGRDVFKVYNELQLEEILKIVFEDNNVILIEEYVVGDDYRLLVLGDEVVMAYKRIPLTIVGNGIDNIENLISIRKTELLERGRKISIEPSDRRIIERLKNFYKTDLHYVPKMGEKIILLENANLSSGGEAVDVTGVIDDSYKQRAIKLTKDMGLRLAGIDFITTEDISKPAINPTFIEINSSPGLTHFQTGSPESELLVENLYFKILMELRNRK